MRFDGGEASLEGDGSESAKCRSSKCCFSAEFEKNWKMLKMGGGSVKKQIQKTLSQHFHSVAFWG